MTRTKFFHFVKSYSLITLGLFIMVIGWVAFLIPARILGGGVTGLSTVIYYITGFPVGLSSLIINGFLVILAIRVLGAKFGLSSIYGIVTVSALLLVMPRFITEPIVQERFMSALIGGALAGVGIGIAFVNGGNSGGTDIIALVVNKYRNISPGRVILYIDLVIIATSYLVERNLETVVYGYVVMGVLTYTLNLVLDGAKQSYQMTIFSTKSREIADKITKDIGRGVTLIKGVGWYTQKETNMLVIIIRKQEKPFVHRILTEIDPEAFTSEAKVSAVFGFGFDRIKL